MTLRNVRLDDVRRTAKEAPQQGFVKIPEKDFVEILEATWKHGVMSGNNRMSQYQVDLAWGNSEMRTTLKEKGYDV